MEGIDYNKNILICVKRYFIGVFMTVVNQYNLEEEKMNVKTTTLMETLKKQYVWSTLKVL